MPSSAARALTVVGTVAGGAALLIGVFWVARERPPGPGCLDVTPAMERAFDAWRAGAAALHIGTAACSLVALYRLDRRRRPAAAYAAVLAAAAVEPGVLAVVGVLPVLLSIVTVPLTSMALLAATVLAHSPAGKRMARAGGWSALVLLIPAHYCYTQSGPATFCMS